MALHNSFPESKSKHILSWLLFYWPGKSEPNCPLANKWYQTKPQKMKIEPILCNIYSKQWYKPTIDCLMILIIYTLKGVNICPGFEKNMTNEKVFSNIAHFFIFKFQNEYWISRSRVKNLENLMPCVIILKASLTSFKSYQVSFGIKHCTVTFAL